MGVIHILRDGTKTKDITGHIVKISDAESLYKLMSLIVNKKVSNQDKRKII